MPLLESGREEHTPQSEVPESLFRIPDRQNLTQCCQRFAITLTFTKIAESWPCIAEMGIVIVTRFGVITSKIMKDLVSIQNTGLDSYFDD